MTLFHPIASVESYRRLEDEYELEHGPLVESADDLYDFALAREDRALDCVPARFALAWMTPPTPNAGHLPRSAPPPSVPPSSPRVAVELEASREAGGDGTNQTASDEEQRDA